MPAGGYFTNAGIFLIDAVFGLYIFAVMLRFFLQVVRADFYNPVSQAIVAVTNPPLKWLRRYIKGYRGVDTASLLLMFVLQLLSSLLVLVLLGALPGLPGLIIYSAAELLSKALYLFMFAVVIQVVLSWFAHGAYNPAIGLLHSLTRPLLRPAQNVLPPMGGLDLSPILVILGFGLARILVVAPLRDIGRALM